MGVEFQRRIQKAIILNGECSEAGLGNRCLPVVMTALTGSDEYGAQWVKEINEERGLPARIGDALPRAGLIRAVNISHAEELPLKNIRAILEDPKGVIRVEKPGNEVFLGKGIEGTLITYRPQSPDENSIGKSPNGDEETEGHVTLIVPRDKLQRDSRRMLRKPFQYMVDASAPGGAVTITPKSLMRSLQRTSPVFTAEISILVKE